MARRRSRWKSLVRTLRAAHPAVRLGGALAAIAVLFFALNWIYQVVRKPAELFFPVSGVLGKTPAQTWQEYQPIFRRHSTTIVTPELLAALAQVESSGNPVARTYWRWRLTTQPMEVYRPASSAVGMYQITDATFAQARRLCIHDHAVSEACWFNALYMRVVPSHAAEMTAAYLHRSVVGALERHAVHKATLRQKQDLAAVIHVCGATAGDAYVQRDFRLAAGQRCGDHDVAAYLARVNQLKNAFVRMANAT